MIQKQFTNDKIPCYTSPTCPVSLYINKHALRVYMYLRTCGVSFIYVHDIDRI